MVLPAGDTSVGKTRGVGSANDGGSRVGYAGAYGIVRNPIYLGMFGILVATGLAVSRRQTFAVGVILFLIGTELRIRSEEKLLREAFSEQFAEYARKVPAFFPRIF